MLFLKQLLSVLLVLLFVKNVYKRCMHLYDINDNFHEFLNASVAKENFTFYSFQNDGHFQLKLISTYGDADIYVSSTGKPSYEPHSYEIASTTCGVDVVELSAAIARPAFIGIYGAGHTEWSNYTLYIMSEEAMTGDDEQQRTTLNPQHRMNFILRYTTIWRIFEIFDSLMFIL